MMASKACLDLFKEMLQGIARHGDHFAIQSTVLGYTDDKIQFKD